MFRSYVKIAWRNIWTNKAFSATSLLGLTIGMACTTLILMWLNNESQWDKFHLNHQNIYKVLVNRDFNGEITTDITSPFPLAAALKANFPEIKNSNYEYRIVISIWLFVGSCFSVLLLTMAIVWMNALRAAFANPVKSLRTE